VPLGQAAIAREGTDLTVVALAATVPIALAAAADLAATGISAEVIDLRCLIPLDMATVLASVAKTSRLLIVEENPYQGGWGATIAAITADEGFELLDAPIRRIAAECVPLPFADTLENQVIPTTTKVTTALRALTDY
jgi:pyruvate/2-oxoglutarate/acetoin dehydrogenase E1 component